MLGIVLATGDSAVGRTDNALPQSCEKSGAKQKDGVLSVHKEASSFTRLTGSHHLRLCVLKVPTRKAGMHGISPRSKRQGSLGMNGAS